MADYLELPLTTDADALLEIGVDYLEGALVGFTARPGNVETVLLESASQIAAEVVAQAAEVPPIIYAGAGGALYGIPRREAVAATGQATLTFAADTPAVLVGEGSLLSVPHPSGDAFAFETDADALSPEGGGDVLVGIRALEPGADANGCFGQAEPVDIIDGLQTVYVASTSGGQDEEDEDAYLDRLTEALTIYAPRPIIAEDWATLARQVDGVGRALALDLFQPPPSLGGYGQPRGPEPDGAEGVERCVTVAITAEDGGPPSDALMQRVWQLLDAAREVNFLEYVVPPTFTTVDVRATVMALPGYLAADVEADAEAQLQAWLDPTIDTGTGTSTDWVQDTSARLYEAVDYLNRANGVHYVVSVELREAGGAWAAADVPLTGAAPLPLPGALDVTVQLP